MFTRCEVVYARLGFLAGTEERWHSRKTGVCSPPESKEAPATDCETMLVCCPWRSAFNDWLDLCIRLSSWVRDVCRDTVGFRIRDLRGALQCARPCTALRNVHKQTRRQDHMSRYAGDPSERPNHLTELPARATRHCHGMIAWSDNASFGETMKLV